MHIDFKAPTLDLTDDMRSYATEKVQALSKHVGNVAQENIRVEVVLAQKLQQQSGDIFRADITMHAGPDRTHAVGHGASVHMALDQAQDDLSRRLRRVRTKRTDTLREGGARLKKMLRFWR